MAFAIEQDESVDKGFARVLRAQLENVQDRLKSPEAAEKESIHEARKSLKKARAALRLVRGAIGESAFRHWNAECRDIGRVVSAARDADVLTETFDQLLEAFSGHVRAGTFASARKHLQSVARAARAADLAAIRQTSGRVRELLGEVDSIELDCDGWDALEPGLSRVYRAARLGLKNSYRQPGDLVFHEWRKNVKYLRHQLDFLRNAWEKPLREVSSQLHDLSDWLGTDHDLAVLRECIHGDPQGFGDEGAVEALYMLVERRQEELRERARPLGERLFAEKTSRFTARIGAYWKAWHRPHAYPSPHVQLVAAQ